jgi:small redox-active disulfide protein 2
MEMDIKILGSGCPNCKRLEALTHEVAGELGIEATFTKVTNPAEIMAYDITSTPALVIDETVVSSGRVPRKDEIAGWLEAIEHTE